MGGRYLRIDSFYDAGGNRTQMRYPDANGFVAFDYCYTGGGQFDRMGLAGACTSPAAELLDFTYDDRGQLTGASRASTALDQSFTYDPVGRLSRNAIGPFGHDTGAQWTLTRNPASQIVRQDLTNPAYSWDARPQGTITRSYTTNGLNQYTSTTVKVGNGAPGSKGVCHDANGNLTSDGVHAYQYDVENRLVRMFAYVASACSNVAYTGEIKAQLFYDPLGRLFEARNYNGGTVSSRTRFLHDGDAIIAEYDGNNNLRRRHLHGPVAADQLNAFLTGVVGTYLQRRDGDESFLAFTRRHDEDQLKDLFLSDAAADLARHTTAMTKANSPVAARYEGVDADRDVANADADSPSEPHLIEADTR